MAMTPDERNVVNNAVDDDNVAPLARHFLWADSQKGVQKFILGLVGFGAFLFAMDFIWHRHVKVPGEELYGFHALAGFISFTVIVLGAKMLRIFIRRDESYYGSHGVDSEEYPEAGTQRLVHEDYREDSLSTLKAQMLGREESVVNNSDSTEHNNGGQTS